MPVLFKTNLTWECFHFFANMSVCVCVYVCVYLCVCAFFGAPIRAVGKVNQCIPFVEDEDIFDWVMN